MNWSDLKLTDFLAVWGAVLSTLTFAMTVVRARPRLKVNLVAGFENDRPCMYIYARNVSSLRVRIETITLLYRPARVPAWRRLIDVLRYRRRYPYPSWQIWFPSSRDVDTGCPVFVEPHASYRCILPDAAVLEVMRNSADGRIVAKVQDSLWKDYHSKAYRAVRYRQFRQLMLWASE